MSKIRVIARLDVKPPYVIKGVHFEGLRKMGQPEALAEKYYWQGADEIFYIDAVASLYQREILFEYIEQTAKSIVAPFCVGGGIRTTDDVARLLHCGADKVVINTAAIANPQLIRDCAHIFGSQCVTVSIEAKRKGDGWECYTDYGRIPSGKDVMDWVKEVQDLGAGELLVTSVDTEGRQKGFDVELMAGISTIASVPVVAAGGAGQLEHIRDVIKDGNVNAVCIASMLHYDRITIREIKEYLLSQEIEVTL
ncbi:MAG: imidazole glycerol phosphate synthase subunit HisF [Candidatus Omnitrophica bacterium]|nr:imidazole glycerol phosphate synthase subunit HisF [Candidatus Omnitrophota bacterium]